MSITPITRFFTMSGMASSEWTLGRASNVEIFLRRIGDQHCLPSLGGASGNALAHFHARPLGDVPADIPRGSGRTIPGAAR